MKAAWFYGGHDIRVGEAPTPEPGPGEVLVRVRAAGICGSDLHPYRGTNPRRGMPIPYLSGHELAGEVAALGPGVSSLAVGQRVAVEPRHLVGCGRCHLCRRGDYHLCRERGKVGGQRTSSTGFAEYSLESVEKLYPLPEWVSMEEACLLDVYACGVHARRLAPSSPASTVVVQGAGPIGLAAMEIFKLGGARKVIATDILDGALEFAKKVGADEVINSARADAVQAVRGLTNGYGADVVVDAVGGNAPIFNSNVAMAAPGGVVIVIGGYFVPQALDTQDARAREVGIRMSNSYSMWDGVPEFKIALDLLAAGKLRAKEYVTHTFPLDRIAEGFTTADRKAETGAIKVVITP